MKCRACGQVIPNEPVIAYENMPKSAQFFPNATEMETECGVNLTVYHCPFCGLLQLSGEPVAYYRDVIRATKVSPAMRIFRLQQFGEWLNRYNLCGKKVLEVGCGAGEFMDIMREAGTIVFGLEHSPTNVMAARSLGLTVYEGFIDKEDKKIQGAPYDAFYILNFLEHNPSPSEYLRGIYNNLSAEAIGLVEVPDVDMILRENLYSEFIQDHLLYFTRDTLCRLLENNGFEIISYDSIWHGYVLSVVVRKRQSLNLSTFTQKEKQMRKNVAVFLKEITAQGIKIAVWGAGHQALANLSLLNMTGYVSYVLDSAKFKQGKFTPATHIPIIDPQEIAAKNIGAVLVMAGSYSGEIMDLLRHNYPHIIRAVLTTEGVVRD